MSSSELELELSSVDLRSKLFKSFKSKGLLQSVKTQLRNRIALELQKKSSDEVTNELQSKNHGSLMLQACNSLFIHHLKSCSYDYTLSVFASESLINPEMVYSVKDILQLLHINPESKLCKKIVKLSHETNFQGFLWSFLLHVAESQGYDCKEISVQTDFSSDGDMNEMLDKKLLGIENMQNEKLQRDSKRENLSLEARVLSYQRKYEVQKRAELSAEMERFKSTELANMRLMEREKYQQEIAKCKAEYDQHVKNKLKEIDRQQEDNERNSVRQKQLNEQGAFEQRQKILSDIQALKERELEMQKTQDIALKSLELEEEKLRSKVGQLRYREEAVKDLENKYEQRLKDEIIKVKFELQKEEHQQLNSLHEREMQLREEKASFQSQKEVFLKWKDEGERLKNENQQLHLTQATSHQQMVTLKHKYEVLAEHYKKVKDYDEIKSENLVLQKSMESLEQQVQGLLSEKAKQHKEHQQLVKELLNKISRNSETGSRVGTNREREDYRNKEEILHETIRTLKHKYELEVLKNEEIQKLYEDSLLSQRELLREVDDLRTALMMANKEKEKLLRNYKSNVGSTAGRNMSVTSNIQSYLGKKPNLVRTNYISTTDLPVFAEGVSGTSDALKRLEQEALDLEKSYKEFQDRQKLLDTKSPSHVHFSSYIQQKSKSTDDESVRHHRQPYGYIMNARENSARTNAANTFDFSQLIPAKTASVDNPQTSKSTTIGQYLPRSSMQTNGMHWSTSLSQPLSSTQAPGGYDAPSLGISGVRNQDTSKKIFQREMTPQDIARMHSSQRPNQQTASEVLSVKPSYGRHHDLGTMDTLPSGGGGLTLPTCGSLTQHMLPEATATADSLTQYTLYDTRYHTTLTQYPLVESDFRTPADNVRELETPGTLTQYALGESDLKTPKALELVTPKAKKLDTLTEQSLAAELSSSEKNTGVENVSHGKEELDCMKSNRVDSVEKEYDLHESSIKTFESPKKHVKNEKAGLNDVFHTPATSFNIVKTLSPDAVENSVNGQIEGNSSVHENEELEIDSNELPAVPSQSSINSQGGLDVDHLATPSPSLSEHLNASSQSLSEGEIADNVSSKKETDDVMAKYMQMVIQKRENVPEPNESNKELDIQDSAQDDIALSEPDFQPRLMSETSIKVKMADSAVPWRDTS